MSSGVHVHFGGTAASIAAAPPIAEQQRMPGTASVPLPAAVASESAAAAAVNAGRVQLATAGDVVGELMQLGFERRAVEAALRRSGAFVGARGGE